MKRSTLSTLASVAILVAGGLAIWFLIVAPRLKIAPEPVPTARPPKTEAPHGALNLYLAAPASLSAGVARVELTLMKATLVDDLGVESPVFQGAQRVMLQSGVVEKVLSEKVQIGDWSRLKLEFSPAAELSMADGTVTAALVERRQAILSFQADLTASRTLALFAAVPLEPALNKAGKTWTAEILPEPKPAERYVFGSYMLDQRGRGNIWTLSRLTLADIIKADLGLDISSFLPGSKGFNPADRPPLKESPQQ